MSHDVIVIGTGVAGLTAAVRLAEGGARVLVLAKGIGSTHLTGGTVDVLGYAPPPGDGEAPAERVGAPGEALAGLPHSHPYARLGGAPAVAAALEWLREQVAASALGPYAYAGGLEENLLLPTAVGVPKPTAMAPSTMLAGDLRAGGPVCIAGFRQLKDFHPALAADNLGAAELERGPAPRASGAATRGVEPGPRPGAIEARSVELDLPVTGRADVNAQGMARALEDPTVRGALVAQLAGRLRAGERVGLPAVLGLDDPHAVWSDVEHRLGCPVFEIPTLPPSVPGMRLYALLRAALRRLGGRIILGPEVVAGVGEGARLEGVRAVIGRRESVHRAGQFVLATGGFASGGLALDSRWRPREAALGLPLAFVPEAGSPRFVPGYFDDQPMARAGLAVDERLRPLGEGGEPVYENVRVAGASLGGAVPWKEKSGDGISLASGHRAAELIARESTAATTGAT
jgi:glycerol-3-phosphate dehydrogenase subunit B